MSQLSCVCYLAVLAIILSDSVAADGVCSSKVFVKGKGVKSALCALQQFLGDKIKEGHTKLDDVQSGLLGTREEIHTAAVNLEAAATEVAALKDQAAAGIEMLTALRHEVDEVHKMVQDLHLYFMGDGHTSGESGSSSAGDSSEEVKPPVVDVGGDAGGDGSSSVEIVPPPVGDAGGDDGGEGGSSVEIKPPPVGGSSDEGVDGGDVSIEVTCRDGYTSAAGKCYHLSPTTMTAADVLVYCRGRSGRVVPVTSDFDLRNLHTFLHDQNVTVNVISVEGLSGPEAFEQISEGTRVVRGDDWEWGEQDGGDGIGTVIRVTDPRSWLRVTWDNGHTNSYRMGVSEKYDLKLAFTESLFLVWLNGRRVGSTWMDGDTEITYLNWIPGQPDNADDLEDCLQVGYSPVDHTVLMNDYNCNARVHAVCQDIPVRKM